MEKKFRNIVKHAFSTIKKEGIDTEEFIFGLTNLPVRSKEQHREFIERSIGNATQTRDVWIKLNAYWNFLNYTLLEHVITEFCDSHGDLIAMMESYKEELKEFRCKTRLCDFTEHYKCVNKSLAEIDRKTLTVKLSKKWEECTLEDLEDWKENVTQNLLLPSFVMIPEAIGPGCVSITWTIPTVFAKALMERVGTMDMKFCEEHGIFLMHLSGVEIYSSTKNPYTCEYTLH